MLWKPSGENKNLVIPQLKALNKQDTITGLTIEAFDGVSEVTQASGELNKIEKAQPSESFARKMYADECEAAVNRQINIEYSISYLYHSMYAFFDRDNVGLPGFIEGEYLEEQVEAIKKVATYVSQLRRIGKGHAVWHFDQSLAN